MLNHRRRNPAVRLCKALQAPDLCNKAALAGVRRELCAASQYSSGLVPQAQEADSLRGRALRIRPQGRESSAVGRIPRVRRAPVVIRRAQEWVRGKVRFRLLLADRRVRVGQHAVQDSRSSPGKKKGR